jgi:hypothetical protein
MKKRFQKYLQAARPEIIREKYRLFRICPSVLLGDRFIQTLFYMVCTGTPVIQGVTKRCRLSLLTNSGLVIRVQMRGARG